MRLVWSEERSLRFDGEFYSLKGMRPGPHPVHDIGIWVGAYGPKMLDLIGRLADGWVPSQGYSPPGRLPEMHRRIDEGAGRAGREPQEIRRAYNVSGSIDAVEEGPLQGPYGRGAPEER
jgi:alkanesulfonate monooxygenase SsuD/methylene tetrahydromethanopterin reductase-like flavin-dependent oxidoreductase (luciferase family)